MALCTSPALMEVCAAFSLLVSAPEIPELSMHEAACILLITAATGARAADTTTLTTVECVRDPEVPVIVNEKVVGVTDGPMVIVSVEVAAPPLAGDTGLELNEVVTPEGAPEVVRVTGELNPLSEVTVTMSFSDPPTLTLIGEGALMEKSGAMTKIGPDVPVMEALAASVAVMVWLPPVTSVAEKVWTPASAGANV
jgi:hypothetical protein